MLPQRGDDALLKELLGESLPAGYAFLAAPVGER
jgi:hypothetical protein